MIKPFINFFNTISVILFSFFFGDTPVTISGNFPKNVKPGTEFTTEITINKGNVGGFAKLQIDVPQGFTVKEGDSKTGNFSFAPNIAKIIWTSMPSDAEFTVKFTFIADVSVSGTKTITSKFSYINNNIKEFAEMTPTEIAVGEASTESPIVTAQTATETPTTITPVSENTTTNPISSTGEPNSTIISSRTITNGDNSNEYNVEVKIKKGNIKGFAKYQEVLPVGFSARSGKTNGSSFSVSDGKLKFVWVSLPIDEELIVSYVLEKSESALPNSKLENGEFSYLENDQSKKIKLQIDAIGNKAKTDIVKETPVQTQTVAAEPINETIAVTQTVATEPKESNVSVSKKQGNVIYHVQIGAFKNEIQSEVLSKKFNISETIKSEMAEGFSKFMIGDFNEYKQARTNRENVKQKGCNSAFVVAYNGAKRITVQEALMITSQKWFK